MPHILEAAGLGERPTDARPAAVADSKGHVDARGRPASIIGCLRVPDYGVWLHRNCDQREADAFAGTCRLLQTDEPYVPCDQRSWPG